MNISIGKAVRFALILAVGVLTACASIVDGGPTKSVQIGSAETGKAFIVKDKLGNTVHKGVTPETVQLPRKGDGYGEGQTYTISFEDGSSPATVKSTVTGWYIAGNIAFGFLVGWLIVDPITGAMYTLKPNQVMLSN